MEGKEKKKKEKRVSEMNVLEGITDNFVQMYITIIDDP